MDNRLVAWARAVKARRGRGAGFPVLWLFTDAIRLPDPRAAVARLPRGLCGVVLRHDNAPDRARLGADLAAICRDRRLTLVVAGDRRLAATLRAGLHLRGGRAPFGHGARRPGAVLTASAHSPRDLHRAHRIRCDITFLSPVFPTASHAGADGLGVIRWAAWASRARLPVLALGGVDGASARRLPPRLCCGAAAIAALA